MTREDLAKDILLALLPEWAKEVRAIDDLHSPVKYVSALSVDLADALLEALGAKEAPASWLSKEMQTPVKPGCLPVLKGESADPLPVVIGCLVVIAESQDPKLASWYGRTGIVGHPCRRCAETLWQVKLGTGDELLVPESCLERVECSWN